jgi:cellulose synthase/poly-beta-1,6-N-acetylglucosamine synthase-like glycosyltransferase
MRALLQRIPGIYAIFFITFLFWGPLYTPISFSFFYLFLHILFINNNFRTAYGIYSVQKAAAKPYIRSYSSSVSHIIILPNYKESMETLTETLDVLASHEQALSNYSVVLAMEGSEAQAVVKAKTLVRMYQDHFALITFTIHPPGLDGEVRGKSSNVCWAVSEIDKKREFGENAVLTIMDSDTCFAQDYFMRVSDAYFDIPKEDRGIVMFVPPTIFDR